MSTFTHPAPSIEVALATYQSARFLRELLDSLFAQTEQGFTLLVADDGSRDATMDILEDYSRRYPGRVRIVARERQPRGAAGNFSRLIEHARADYLLLCDHDDVWLPNKISLSRARMTALEKVHGTEAPLLVHTDLVVVDEDLEVIAPSLSKYWQVSPPRSDLTSLLTANVATGCTIIMNRALYERARPIPPEAMMHDHWLALVAATLGAIAYVEEATILYRQHGGNLIGAPTGGTASLIQRIRHTLFGAERQRVMRRYSRQAAALLRRYRDEMTGEKRRATETLAGIWSVSRWRRFARLRRSGAHLSGFARNVALFIVVTRKYAE
jgi:glycosyltransferase involved in cell wall biosynthesis